MAIDQVAECNNYGTIITASGPCRVLNKINIGYVLQEQPIFFIISLNLRFVLSFAEELKIKHEIRAFLNAQILSQTVRLLFSQCSEIDNM